MQKEGSYSIFLNPRIIKGLLSLGIKGYFVQKGWLKAYLKKQAIAADDEPIPWLTYSFLDFIEGRLTKDLTLLEYGSGNSTLFFAKHLLHIRSIEHDEDWFNKIKTQVPKNATITHIPLINQQYEKAVLEETKHYDIVLIDGRERIKCLKNATQRLTDKGVVILDDAERPQYQEAFSFMKSQGFKSIPFSGIAIGAIHHKQTVIFYKQKNCFDI